MNNNNKSRSEQEREQLRREEIEEEKIIEKYRRLEYGDYYDTFFKKCDNCGKIFQTNQLYFVNTAETIKVCSECFAEIKIEESTREMQRLYK
jgi:hypothetical protein